MKHLESMETVLQDSMYQTPLTDGQIYVTYPSELIDYAIVKNCIVKWSLKIAESESGLDNLIPVFKSVEIDIVLKCFIPNSEDDATENVLKKYHIDGKNVSIEENIDNFTLPFKPVKMEIDIDTNLNCNKCTIDFYDYSK